MAVYVILKLLRRVGHFYVAFLVREAKTSLTN